MTLSSPVAFNACFQVTEQILYKNDKEQLRSKTVTTTLDPERLGLSGATHAKGYRGMDPSWYSHALPRDRSPAGRGREQCLEHVGGVLSRPVAVVVRLVRAVPVCSRWAARNPWCLTKSINSNAIKKKGKKLKVFLC